MKKLILTLTILTITNMLFAQNTNVKNIAENLGTTETAIFAQGINQTLNNTTYQRWVVSTEVKEIMNKKIAVHNKQEDKITFEVYPNPVSNGTLNVRYKFDKEGKIDIVDVTGKLVKTIQSTQYETNYSININELQPGVYICILQDGTSVHSQKVVVQ